MAGSKRVRYSQPAVLVIPGGQQGAGFKSFVRKVGQGLGAAHKWGKKNKPISKLGAALSATGLGATPAGQKILAGVNIGKQLGYGQKGGRRRKGKAYAAL